MPKKGRKTSKRTTLKDKYKIQKRVVEKHRKDRKNAKKDTKGNGKSRTKSNKDPGIPNSWPFKDQLLREVDATKQRMEERKRRIEDEKRLRDVELSRDKRKRNLEELVNDANQANAAFNNNSGGDDDVDDGAAAGASDSIGQSSRRAYLRELRKVIDSSDVILQVLDARFPHSSRATAIEDAILSNPSKKVRKRASTRPPRARQKLPN